MATYDETKPIGMGGTEETTMMPVLDDDGTPDGDSGTVPFEMPFDATTSPNNDEGQPEPDMEGLDKIGSEEDFGLTGMLQNLLGDDPVGEPTKPLAQPPVQQPVPDAELRKDVNALSEAVGHVGQNVSEILENSTKNTGELTQMAKDVREMHRLYHGEFSGRLRKMEEELDAYHAIDRGKAFDGILGEVARICSDNAAVVDIIDDANAKKSVSYLMMDLEQLLETYGIHRHESKAGEPYDVKMVQVVERVPADDPALVGKVIESRRVGYCTDRRPVIKEMVSIYVRGNATPAAE